MAELSDRKICGERRLLTLFPYDPDSNCRSLDHTDIISTIADGTGPLSGVCLYQPNDFRFLSRGTTATNNCRTVTCDLHKFLRVKLEYNLS